MASGILSFSDALSFRIGWGRVAADGSEIGEIRVEENPLLVGRETLGPITGSRPYQ